MELDGKPFFLKLKYLKSLFISNQQSMVDVCHIHGGVWFCDPSSFLFVTSKCV